MSLSAVNETVAPNSSIKRVSVSIQSFASSFLPKTWGMGDLLQSFDWEQTALGAPETWPQSLRTVTNILLTSRYAMWMGWGESLTFLYNDAYRPTLGLKHPWAFGRPAKEVWKEIWHEIGPRIDTVISTGEATYDEGLLLFLERSGFPEETYHTFSYSPLADDSGQVCGMLCVVTEETERILSERRMTTLRELAAALSSSNAEREVLAAVEQQLGGNPKDLPFALLYLYEGNGGARLAASTGMPTGHPAAPPRIGPGDNWPWPADEMLHHPRSQVVDRLGDRWSSEPLPSGAWNRPPEQAAVVSIRQQGHDRPAGFLVVGINPYRKYGEEYSGFLELIAGQLAGGLSSVRAYEEERRRAEALAELDRAKTVFFSNVSHEFRTPLTLLLGPVEDLLADPDCSAKPEYRHMLQVVHRSGLRLQRLVNTLLDFSRIEAGRMQASYVATDLSALTADLASTFRSAMERAGLQFTVDCEPLTQPVYVDRDMWEKVVLNLLSNAFKYTLEGSVSVRLREQDGKVELTVTDTGAGIPEHELPRLFERFHRVEHTRGRTHEGTGIGLALVSELAKLHRGEVSVRSSLGHGTTFTVSLNFGTAHLPADRIEAGKNLGSASEHANAYVEEALRWLPETISTPWDAAGETENRNASPARSRVLLADDNTDMREYIRRLLEKRYEVVAVSNGSEALSAAVANPPDLILSDVMMPELDGFGLLKSLRADERTKTLPIILLSARAGEESYVEGLDAGADDYLFKPFTARELLARVDAHLSLVRMRRQADQARRLSEARLGLALDATNMVAWQWDPVSDTVVSTGDLALIFGKAVHSSAEGFALVHPDDMPRHRSIVERVARHGGSYASEFRINRADTNTEAWLEDRATSIMGESGEVECVVGVLIDITKRKAAEREMQNRNEELARVNGELEEFAYVASHDLKEPLRSINIFSQLLLERVGLQDDEQASRFAAFIRDGVARMELLIRDLLDYARVVHPEQETAVPTDLNRSLEEATTALRGLIRETGATITCETLPVVIGDEQQLGQVFQNLLSNALKYRRDGVPPEVKIGAERSDGNWLVSVADNGIGFGPQYAQQIFGLFKRLHKDNYPGSGLGLAICKRVVERYGGRIWATSDGEGRGATIHVTLRAHDG